MKPTVAFQTLGCRLNQFETDAVVTDFVTAGYRVVPWNNQADVFVVNTCTVTGRSDRKSRQLINQTQRSGTSPVVVVTGCFAEGHRDYLENTPGATYIVDNDRKSKIFDLVDAHFRGEIVNPVDLPRDRFAFASSASGFHTRSAIKIQDGCDNFCSFCIIPQVRGRAISRPMQEIVDGVQMAVGEGAKEIVITGVNISRYQRDRHNFCDVVERILAVPGEFRVRVSSLEPDNLGDRFIDLFANPKLCPHLHLCLQSGSDRILLLMRRQYTIDSYVDIVEKLRSRHPLFNLTTDIMTGFPGESDIDFEQTCSMVKKMAFGHVHTFPYSPRNGTNAARRQDQIPDRTKSERAAQIRALSILNKNSYRRRLIGTKEMLLVEKNDGNAVFGYGQHYVPISAKVDRRDQLAETNRMVAAHILAITDGEDPVLEATVAE